jgi:hypothetical protein
VQDLGQGESERGRERERERERNLHDAMAAVSIPHHGNSRSSFRCWLPAAFVFHPALLRRPSSVFRVLLPPSIAVRRRSVVRPPTKGDVRDARRESCIGPTLFLFFPGCARFRKRPTLFFFFSGFARFRRPGLEEINATPASKQIETEAFQISYDRRRVDGPRLEANFKAYFLHAGASFQKERNSATHARKIGCTASHGNML